MNVLIVDDEPFVLRLMEEQVQEALPDASLHLFDDPLKAIEFAAQVHIEIAFLDIDMGVMNGIEMAKRLQDIHPPINIIFCTGYAEYMPEAWKLYSSGYLLKPVMEEDLQEALMHLRYPIPMGGHSVRFHCFGNFEAFCDNRPITFTFSRTKELLAYLVDRDGVDVTSQELMAVPFEGSIGRAYFSQLRNDLIHTFEELGISDVLRVSRGILSIEKDKVECDYFDFLDGKRNNLPAEYMAQYSFGEVTLAGLCSDSFL